MKTTTKERFKSVGMFAAIVVAVVIGDMAGRYVANKIINR